MPFLFLCLISAGCGQLAGNQSPYNQRWWKGNLHTHTLWSDGDDYPEMVGDWYKKNGYNFLALTDHRLLQEGTKWVDNKNSKTALGKYIERFGPQWVEQQTIADSCQVRLKPLSEYRCLFEEPDRFLLIQGKEVDNKDRHLNAINITQPIPQQEGDTNIQVLQNFVNAVNKQRHDTGRPMFCQINHPNYQWALTAEDISQIRDEQFFEIFNGVPSANNCGSADRAGTERMWDIILTKRLAELNLPVMYGLATDDAHIYNQWSPGLPNPGRGWIVVRSPCLTPESIIKSMEAGSFYASTGVVLKNISFDGNTLKVIIKPEKGDSYTTQFIGTLKGYDPTSKPVVDANGIPVSTTRIYSNDIGKVLSRVDGPIAAYHFTGNEIYVRAKVISTKPKDNSLPGTTEVAWVQPVVPGKH